MDKEQSVKKYSVLYDITRTDGQKSVDSYEIEAPNKTEAMNKVRKIMLAGGSTVSGIRGLKILKVV